MMNFGKLHYALHATFLFQCRKKEHSIKVSDLGHQILNIFWGSTDSWKSMITDTKFICDLMSKYPPPTSTAKFISWPPLPKFFRTPSPVPSAASLLTFSTFRFFLHCQATWVLVYLDLFYLPIYKMLIFLQVHRHPFWLSFWPISVNVPSSLLHCLLCWILSLFKCNYK